MSEVQRHDSNIDAQNTFQEAFDRIVQEGQWMAAVWCIRDGKIVLDRVTTRNYPVGDMLPSVGLLANRLHVMNMDTANVSKPEPLPEALPRPWEPDREQAVVTEGTGEENKALLESESIRSELDALRDE